MLIYADTASLAEIERLNDLPFVAGFTTNPSIFKAEGVTNPEQHAKEILRLTDKPVSIDGPPEKVWALGPNAIPKICLWRSRGRFGKVHGPVNWTAVCTIEQLERLPAQADDIVSVFAGRIMDACHDPQPVIDAARATGARVLWASTREPYNYVMAERAGCDIITMPPVILDKWYRWQYMLLDDIAAMTLRQFEADRVDW